MIDSSMVAQAVPDRDQELSFLADGAQLALDHARSLGADNCETSVTVPWDVAPGICKLERKARC